MKRILLTCGTILLTAMGCAPQVQKGVLEPATRPALTVTTRPIDPPTPGKYRVVEIITKPTLIKRTPSTASTTRSTSESGTMITQGPAVGPTAPTPDAPVPRFTLNDLKRVDTSLSTAPLLRLVTMKLNGVPYQRFAGYGAIDFTPELPEGVNPDAMTSDILAREPSGSAVSVDRLIRGEVDLILLSRQPTPQELDAAQKAGVNLRSDLLATEALVFTVNTNNPTKNLTRSQLKDIFSGKTQKWADAQIPELSLTSQLASKQLTVAYRAKGLGTEELMSHLLLDGAPVPELPVSQALSSEKLVLDATDEDAETIGFSVFCYAVNMKRDGRSKVLAVDGVLPEPAKVASGIYPLTTPIYVVARGNLESTNDMYGLRRWLLAMNGQKVLAEAGYLPVIQEAWTEQRLMEPAK